MKQFLLLTTMMIAFMHSSFAQDDKTHTMKIWSNGVSTSYQVEKVDSITFSVDDTGGGTPVGQITEESVWQNESDVLSVLMASYMKFQSFITYEKRLEELAVNGGDERILPTSSSVNKAWTNGYYAISYCNKLIDATENMSVEFDVKKYQTHAKSLRAVIYYMMAQLWGNIPYVESSSVEDVMNIKIGNRQEIVNDSYYYLKFNIDNLADIFESNVQTINPTNIRPLMNEMSMYVDGAVYESIPTVTDFIMNLDNSQETYPIVDATFNLLLNQEHSNPGDNDELSNLWKNNMPRYGVWNALKRLGAITPTTAAQSDTGMASCLLFPIPQNELMMNPNLKQNEGY